jgi:hypothetical protein
MYGPQTQGISPKSYEAVPEPSRQVEVASAASDVEYNLAELEQSLALLANRLAPVLSVGILNHAQPGDSAGYSCELAQRLSGATSRLRTLRAGVGELLGRLEI